jgi:Protein of unknown function (DUF3485)
MRRTLSQPNEYKTRGRKTREGTTMKPIKRDTEDGYSPIDPPRCRLTTWKPRGILPLGTLQQVRDLSNYLGGNDLDMQKQSRRAAAGLFTVPFTVSLIILAVTAVGLGPVTRYLNVVLRKEAVPLRKQLGTLDKSRLGPYKFVRAYTIESAVVDTLGTDKYINWLLEDTRRTGRDPLRYVSLFVTYYTGQPDPVPHTPDVCYAASGYEPDEKVNLTVDVPTLGKDSRLPIRLLMFVKTGVFNSERMPLIYTFHCNGKFVATREGVRTTGRNPLDKHAYYSKVEVKFGWKGAQPRYPDKKQAIEASTEFLSHVLPLLVDEHWPDWAAVKAAEKADQEV